MIGRVWSSGGRGPLWGQRLGLPCDGQSFPFGTLAVNLIGCFLLGAVAHISQTTELIPTDLQQGITVRHARRIHYLFDVWLRNAEAVAGGAVAMGAAEYCRQRRYSVCWPCGWV